MSIMRPRLLKTVWCPGKLSTPANTTAGRCANIKVPRDVYITVVGTDLIRTPDGNFVVLEDNLRVPQRRLLHADQSHG